MHLIFLSAIGTKQAIVRSKEVGGGSLQKAV